MLIELKSTHGDVLFSHDCEDNSISKTVAKAVNEGVSLRNVDLSDSDLSGADLRYADLSGADLSGADLRNADLSYADLSGADLRYADLSRTDLRNADLIGVNIDYSDGWAFSQRHSRFNIDMKFAYQVLAHLCSCKCDNDEWKGLKEKMLPYAIKSHMAKGMEIE